ncbi:hypothetical protein [Glycomyces tenuis]|uniref:hypothetical protein n=1 Tax=Glycomyces tenuis TaxID=58116 RepID=UPI000558F97F|nr:hypothetical protein [Glycomyces tenuis]
MQKSYAGPMDIIDRMPDEARAYWERRAKVAGVSLNEYLLQKLIRDAAAPSNRELFEEIDREATAHLSSEEAVEILRELRESR